MPPTPSTKPFKTDAALSKRRIYQKEELESLRSQVDQLQRELARLQRRHHQFVQAHPPNSWQVVALTNHLRKQTALQTNQNLKHAIHQQRQLAELLVKLLARTHRVGQVLGSQEDNEWRLGVLSFHPERRKLNADRIMNKYFGDLPNQAITSGLVDVHESIRYTKCANAQLLARPGVTQVNLCQKFVGNYERIADSFWQDSSDLISLADGAFLRNDLAEFFDEDTSHWIAMTFLGSSEHLEDAQPTGIKSHSLARRSFEPGCITAFFKTVRESNEDPNSDWSIAENCSGWYDHLYMPNHCLPDTDPRGPKLTQWVVLLLVCVLWTKRFTLQDGGVDSRGRPVTVFKCSMSAELRPLTDRLELMVTLAHHMQLGDFVEFFQEHDEATRKRTEKAVRDAFLEYITALMWCFASRHEANLRQHSNSYLQEQAGELEFIV